MSPNLNAPKQSPVQALLQSRSSQPLPSQASTPSTVRGIASAATGKPLVKRDPWEKAIPWESLTDAQQEPPPWIPMAQSSLPIWLTQQKTQQSYWDNQQRVLPERAWTMTEALEPPELPAWLTLVPQTDGTIRSLIILSREPIVPGDKLILAESWAPKEPVEAIPVMWPTQVIPRAVLLECYQAAAAEHALRVVYKSPTPDAE